VNNLKGSSTILNESSPSVQAHLQILQAVINRMATNSTSCKAWCITLVSAILVIVADKGKPNFAFIALLPTVLFLSLDAYYLAHEKAFRLSYNQFIKNLHLHTISLEDLFAVVLTGSLSGHQFSALRSFSVWGFYSSLAVLIELTRSLVIK